MDRDLQGRGRAASAWAVWLLAAFLAKWKKLGERQTFTDSALTSAVAHTSHFSVINRSCRGQWQSFGSRKTWVQIFGLPPPICMKVADHFLFQMLFPLPGGYVKSPCAKPQQSSWSHTEDPPRGHMHYCAPYCKLVRILYYIFYTK